MPHFLPIIFVFCCLPFSLSLSLSLSFSHSLSFSLTLSLSLSLTHSLSLSLTLSLSLSLSLFLRCSATLSKRFFMLLSFSSDRDFPALPLSCLFCFLFFFSFFFFNKESSKLFFFSNSNEVKKYRKPEILVFTDLKFCVIFWMGREGLLGIEWMFLALISMVTR